MRIAGTVGGVILAFMGSMWMLQGVDSQFAPQSFMTSSRVWIVIGALALGGGIVLVRWSWNQR
jgi:hypothetical protein